MVIWRRKKTADTQPVARPRWARWLRRLVRGVLTTLMWVIILAAVLLLGLYGSGSLREKLLGVGLEVAAKSLPGRIELAQAKWPEPGHLRLTDLVWSGGQSPPDTLAHIAVLDLHVDLKALRFKDVAVDSLLVVANRLDGPAMERVWREWAESRPAKPLPETEADRSGPSGFPRPGAIAGWPSVGLAHGQVELVQADLTEDVAVAHLVFIGALEARHGQRAQAVVEHLEMDFSTTAMDSLTAEPWRLSLQHLGLGLTLDPADDPADDRAGDLAGDPVASIESFVAVLDSLTLRFDAMGQGAGDSVRTWRQASGPVRLANTARISRSDAGYRGTFTSDFVLPGAEELRAFLPPDFPLESFGQLAGRLALDGVYDGPRLDLQVDLDLGQTSWLDRGLLRGHLDSDLDEIAATGLDAVSAQIDTLDFALLGAELAAAGEWRQGVAALNLRAAVSDPHLVAVFLPDSLAGTEALFDLTAQLTGTRRAPALALDLQGELRSSLLTLPRLDLQLRGDLAAGQLDLSLPAGLVTPAAQLDSLRARVTAAREPDDVLACAFGLDAWRGADYLALGGQVWADSLGRIPNRVSPADTRYRGQITSDFDLSEVPELRAFLPPDFPHERFDQLAGRLSLDGVYDGPRLDLQVDLDLGQTSWLDRGLLRGHLDSDLDAIVATGLDALSAQIDTLDFALLGAELAAAGEWRQGVAALNLSAAVTDTHLVAVFLPDSLAGTETLFDLTAQLAGTRQAPELALDLQGELRSRLITLPRLNLQLSGNLAAGQLDLSLPAGLVTPTAHLDSLRARVTAEREPDDVLAGKFGLDAWRGADRLGIGGQAWVDSLGRAGIRKVQLDSLVVVTLGRDVRLQQPAVLKRGPGPWDLDLSALVIAGEPGEFSVVGRLDEAGMDLATRITLLLPEEMMVVLAPADIWSADGGQDLSLTANLDLKGTRAEPTMQGQLDAHLVPRRGGSSFGIGLGFALAAGDSAGVHSEFAVRSADSTVLSGTADLPGRFDSQTGVWQPTPGQPARLTVPEQSLGLEHVNRLMPTDVSLEGDLDFALAVEGPLARGSVAGAVSSGKVTGYVRAPQLALRLPNRSRVDANVALELTGDLKDPVVGGQIKVKSGFIRLPEIPRTLLAAEGQPLLWALDDSVTAWPESLQVFVMPTTTGPDLSPSGPVFLPEMDLQILMPGNLRIHGYGLDLELAGDLKVRRGFDKYDRPQPKVHGNVNVVQGTLQFMNRVFKVERGDVRFNGAVPPDPTLDLRLEAVVSGTIVRIQVSGLASDPVVELSSEPDYSEQDIMAVLLFGRPLSELDNDQSGGVGGESTAAQQLRQNLAGLAMVFGTAGLQNKVSSSLGVDMVEVGSGTAGDSTLMVGKFINPKLMLKYHHSLEKSGTYFLTMEYALTRLFNLVTTYGQGGEGSGLELKWTRRY